MNEKTNIEERLNKHPELMVQVLALLELSEGGIQRADEVEERTITSVQKIGQQVIQNWADHQQVIETQRIQLSDNDYEMKGKKNSTGTRPLEK